VHRGHLLEGTPISPLAGLGGEGGQSGAEHPPSSIWWWLLSPMGEGVYRARRGCIFFGSFSSSRAGALRRELDFSKWRRRILDVRCCCSSSCLLFLGAVVVTEWEASRRCSDGGHPRSSEAILSYSSKSEANSQQIILAKSRPSSLSAKFGDHPTSIARPSCCRDELEGGPDCFLLYSCRTLFVKRLDLAVLACYLGSYAKTCISIVWF